MFDDNLFDHLKPTAPSLDIVLHGITVPGETKPIVLVTKFCGKGSRYHNAVSKRRPLGDEREEGEAVATLFAKLGVVDWKNVSKNGAPAPFSHEGCAEILCKLIAVGRATTVLYAIQRAMDPDNYCEGSANVDPVDLGKG